MRKNWRKYYGSEEDLKKRREATRKNRGKNPKKAKLWGYGPACKIRNLISAIGIEKPKSEVRSKPSEIAREIAAVYDLLVNAVKQIEGNK